MVIELLQFFRSTYDGLEDGFNGPARMFVSVEDAKAAPPTLEKFRKQAGVVWDVISMALITAVIRRT